jgi:hypothetical protein
VDEKGSSLEPLLDREIVDESRHFLLGLTPQGWGVWDRSLSSDEPVAFFPEGDDGYDQAAEYFARANRAARFRRWSWSDVWRWVAYVSGAMWVLGTALLSAALWSDNGDNFDTLRWVQIAADIGYSVFLVSVAVSVLMWLHNRERS